MKGLTVTNYLFLLGILMLSTSSVFAQDGEAQNDLPPLQELLVKFYDDTPQNVINDIKNEFNATEIAISPITEVRLWRLEPYDQEGVVFQVGGQGGQLLDIQSTGVELENKAEVQSGGINHFVIRDPTPAIECYGELFPCDLVRGLRVGTGNCSVNIALIDTGVDIEHEYIAPYIWQNAQEVLDGEDNDGNGYIDDLNGYNFIADNRFVADDHGHGTHIGGIIAQNLDCISYPEQNHIRVMPLKTQDENGLGTIFHIIEALDYAMIKEVQIANISLKWMEEIPEEDSGKEPPFEYVMNVAKADYQMLIVIAAGNDHTNIDEDNLLTYPAEFPNSNTLVVGALGCEEEEWAEYSNFGDNSVDVFAPGTAIYSTLPNNVYGVMSGTSMAAPFVSAIAAIIASIEDDETGCNFDYKPVANKIREYIPRFYDTNFGEKEGKNTGINSAANVGSLIQANDSVLEVFPQPFSQEVSFRYYIPDATSVFLEILDTRGHAVFSQKLESYQGWNTYQWNQQDLPTGMYVVKIKSGEETLTQKLLKQ